MSEALDIQERRHQRYQINDACHVDVRIMCDDGATDAYSGSLVDLSSGGARVVLDAPLPFNKGVMVRLTCPEIELDIAVSATVCWVRPKEERWYLGCQFDPELPAEKLEEYAIAGLLERRIAPRLPVELPAKARWELRQKCDRVQLVNLGEGGCCLQASDACETGGRVRLSFPEEDIPAPEVEARAQWQMKVADGFLIGCQFNDPQSYDVIAKLAALRANPGERRRQSRLNRLVYLAIIGLASLVIWYWLVTRAT